ncbi:MAG TPA: DUF4142 domain-containing protein [Candidatus Binatia bacterium]|nr:DUF4142 domain-containing protein [Candidatus Binatia bacterium]
MTSKTTMKTLAGMLAGTALALAPVAVPAQQGPDTQHPGGSAAGIHTTTDALAPTGEAAKRGQGDVPATIDAKKFLNEAAIGGIAEVQLAKIAEQRARSPQVKQFAQTMDRDHSRANERLAEVAKKVGVQVPDQLDPDHQQLADRLTKLEADDFDADYMKAMVDDHEKDVAAFQQATQSKDTEVAKFAEETLPVLRRHLEMARQIDNQVTMRGPAGTKYDGAPDRD